MKNPYQNNKDNKDNKDNRDSRKISDNTENIENIRNIKNIENTNRGTSLFFRLLSLLRNIYVFIYPFLIYFLVSTQKQEFSYLAIGLMLLLNIPYKNIKLTLGYLLTISAFALVLFFYQPHNIVRIFPFLMSVSFLVLFCGSLGKEKSILEVYVTPFKKITDWEKIYFKRITPLWIGFLSINSLILFILIFAYPIYYWLLYSGCISYILIITMVVLSIVLGRLQKR